MKLPWFHQWSSDNGEWNIFSFTTKFDRINGMLTVVGESVYVATEDNAYENPEDPSNLHVPFNEAARNRLPEDVISKAEEIYSKLNHLFLAKYYSLKNIVEYDDQTIAAGENVERLDEWKKAPEGHYIAIFRILQNGVKIPLMMDEIVPEDMVNAEKVLKPGSVGTRPIGPDEMKWKHSETYIKEIDPLLSERLDHVNSFISVQINLSIPEFLHEGIRQAYIGAGWFDVQFDKKIIVSKNTGTTITFYTKKPVDEVNQIEIGDLNMFIRNRDAKEL